MRLSERMPGRDTVLLEQDAVPDPVEQLRRARRRLEATRARIAGSALDRGTTPWSE
jgi:hypothetical protein